MRRCRDVSADITVGNRMGLIVELSSGRLLCAGSTDTSGMQICTSDDDGETWVSKASGLASRRARGAFISSAGAAFFTLNAVAGTPGGIFRTADAGETWAEVLRADTEWSGFWIMCEDASGNLYAAEYNGATGPSDTTIYKSTNGGATWSAWHVETVAVGAVRHTHIVAAIGDRVFAGFGENITPGTIHGGKFYWINSDGSLGDLIADAGNGMVGMMKSATGKYFLCGDVDPGIVYGFDPDDSTICQQFKTNSLGREFGRYLYTGCVGRDGVLYACGYSPAEDTQYLYASADDGATWQVLDINTGGLPTVPLTYIWASGPSGKVFFGNGSWLWRELPDYTRAQLRKRFEV